MNITKPLYAQDACDITAVMSTLQAAIEASASEHTWFALIDTAFDYGRDAATIPRHLAFNCYDFPDLQDLKESAPLLLPLLGLNEAGWAQQLAALLTHCTGRPMLSFMALRKGTEGDALEHWHPLHWAHTSDGQKLLLRFADTRTQAVLPQVLTPVQWSAWTRPLQAWWLVDRSGQLVQLFEKAAVPTMEPLQKLKLDDDQVATFIAGSEPDAALLFLQQHLPDIIPTWLSGHGFYSLASHALEKTSQHGIENWGDKMALIAAACMSHGSVLQAPELDALLAQRDCPEGDLGPYLAEQSALKWLMSSAQMK